MMNITFFGIVYRVTTEADLLTLLSSVATLDALAYRKAA
jgi:hypothetical protein